MKSGTSITVSMALDQGREVYACPGRITDRLSDGCNRMIKQGAAIYLDPESFVEELAETYFMQRISPIVKKKEKKRNSEPKLSEELLEVWRTLDLTPRSVEEIQGLLPSGIDAKSCSVRLMELVLNGKAKQVSSGYFCRT